METSHAPFLNMDQTPFLERERETERDEFNGARAADFAQNTSLLRITRGRQTWRQRASKIGVFTTRTERNEEKGQQKRRGPKKKKKKETRFPQFPKGRINTNSAKPYRDDSGVDIASSSPFFSFSLPFLGRSSYFLLFFVLFCVLEFSGWLDHGFSRWTTWEKWRSWLLFLVLDLHWSAIAVLRAWSPLISDVSGYLDGVAAGPQDSPPREPDGVQPVAPSPAIRKWCLGHAFLGEEINPLHKKRRR